MGKVRGHNPFVIEEINGLWDRGEPDSCPSDHLLLATNIQFYHSGIELRQGVAPYAQGAAGPFSADLRLTKRVYTFTTQKSQTLIVLAGDGVLYHVVSPTVIYNILNRPMDDFAFISINGRAYISPIKYHTDPSGALYALGMPNECVYVYQGDQNPVEGIAGARPIAGLPPTNATITPPPPAPGGVSDGGKKPMIGYNSTHDGKVTKGIHIITVAIDGGQGSPDFSPVVNAPGEKMIQLDHVPKGGTTRSILMTKAISPDTYKSTHATTYGGQFYLVGTITDAAITTFTIDKADEDFPAAAYIPNATPGPVTGGLLVENTETVGFCDPGFHLIAVVYESDTGYLSAPGPEVFGGNTYINEKRSVKISNIPLAGPPYALKRHIVSTKTIPEYNGDQKGYQFFFVPKATLQYDKDIAGGGPTANATEIIINYYDSDLVADASHLVDNFSKVPAGVNFCEYHSRLVLVGGSDYPLKLDGKTPDTRQADNRGLARISVAGEPEAFSQVDGIVVPPLDGQPLTNCQDFRDVLYLFKQNRTYSVVDNEDEPTTWGPVEVVDQGVGTSIHGIAEVLDSGGTNVDYLITADYSGLMLFNGTYARPELSWKIENTWVGHPDLETNEWLGFDKKNFIYIQLVNDSIRKKIWVLEPRFPAFLLYMADYNNGLNPKDIRWAMWKFAARMSSINLHRTDKMIIGLNHAGPIINPLHSDHPLARLKKINPADYPDPVYSPKADPSPAAIGGGLLVLDPANKNRYDEYLGLIPGQNVTAAIVATIFTALLGE